jgi:hypothetical protein
VRMGEDKARVAAYILEALLDLPLVRAGRAVDLVDRVLRAHRATGGWFASDGARGHGRTGWSRRAGQQRESGAAGCERQKERERESERERSYRLAALVAGALLLVLLQPLGLQDLGPVLAGHLHLHVRHGARSVSGVGLCQLAVRNPGCGSKRGGRAVMRGNYHQKDKCCSYAIGENMVIH